MIPKWIKRYFGATETAYEPGTGRIVAASHAASTGRQVTVETALSIPAIFHGLRTIGQTIGSLDFDLWHHTIEPNSEGVEQSRQEIARLHPVHTLLHNEPNEFQNAAEWRETMCAHAALAGDGISYIERNGNFRPQALLPLMPDRTKPVVNAGKLTYETMVNGERITIDPWNIFHVKGFSWNGISGMPVVRMLRDALGLDLAQMGFASMFYANGASMDGVVEVAGALSDTARQNLKSSMRREYAGIGNAFRTIFLEEGMKYTKLGVEPQNAQYIEGRKFSLGDMARVIGLPPHLLYDLSQSTNNNIEHQGIEAVTYCFKAWANKFTQEADRKLLYESEKFEYATRIDLKPLMAGDSTAQAAKDTSRFQTLSITPNEIRAGDGRNPLPGGDTVFLNTAYLPLATAIARAVAQTARIKAPSSTAPAVNVPAEPTGEGVNSEVDEGDDTPPAIPGAGVKPPDGLPGPKTPADLIDDTRAAVIAPVVRDAVGRVIRRETRAIEAALAKHADSPQKFRRWFADFQQAQRGVIAEVLQPAAAAAEAVKLRFTLDEYIEGHLARTARDVETILGSSIEQRSDARWSVLSSWQQARVDQATNQLIGKTP